jgi:hypothetical protein
MMSKTISLTDLVDKRVLPKLAKMDDYLQLVNHDTPQQYVKDHPMAKGVKYVPIEIVETFLTKLFQQWRVEVRREGQMLNSIFVTVRLHFKHPISQEWDWQDGVGAAPIQTDKGMSAADLAAIKNDAIMKALPAAESFAVKDAAEKIGKVFGRDLNRRDAMTFTPSYGTDEVKEALDKKRQELRRRLNAGTKSKQEGRPAGVDGNAPVEDNRQEQQADKTPK